MAGIVDIVGKSKRIEFSILENLTTLSRREDNAFHLFLKLFCYTDLTAPGGSAKKRN